MKIAILLHFYQPHSQQPDILNRVVHESYIPIIKGLLERPHSKVIVNISGALVELLHMYKYDELLLDIRRLVKLGRIEITQSSMYHAFLPLMPDVEMKRQISLNNAILTESIGLDAKPLGFFSPEMAISSSLLHSIIKLGYKWIAVPEVANSTFGTNPNMLYKDKSSGMNVFFRNKRVSSLILSSVAKSAEELIEETRDLHGDTYWFVVMDAETFGHHRIGHEKLLFDILDSNFFTSCHSSDLLSLELSKQEVDLRSCTWTNEEQDFWLDDKSSFILWKDPKNPIHTLQWELTDLVIDTVNDYHDKGANIWKEARKKLDTAIASDQYWWASAKPWWSLEIIEQGAFSLKNVLSSLSGINDIQKQAENLYRKILDQAFEWQRTGYIRDMHLKNSSTYMKRPFKKRTPNEWYNQILLEFDDEMTKAAKSLNFEKAIKWRDAIYKLKNETDIYDVLHVVNELWSARNIPQVKPFLEHSWEEFSEFVKENLENAPTKEAFEKWRKEKTSKK